VPTYSLIDADQHYYEPYDCYTRHIEAKFRDQAVHPVVGADGLGRVYQGDRRLAYTPTWFIDYVGAPGVLNDFYKGKVADRSQWIEKGFNARDFPEFVDRSARLSLMDQQGTERVFMIPTLGVAVEHDLHKDPAALYANFRSFNRWLQEDWGFGEDNRIYGVPYLSLVDPAEATKDVEWMLEQGVTGRPIIRPGMESAERGARSRDVPRLRRRRDLRRVLRYPVRRTAEPSAAPVLRVPVGHL
jgi:hypothetical protein